MQTIHTGIIVDDTIRLDGPINLPNGLPVQVVLIPQETTKGDLTEEDLAFLDELMQSRSDAEQIRRCAGALADLPQAEFDDLDEIIAGRQQAFFRDIEG